VRFDPDARSAALAMPGLESPRGTYTLEPQLAARAADLWAAHTLARPAASRRLFIEGYYMRGLVATYEALTTRRFDGRSADTERGVLQALSFADWMLNGQNDQGYWPLGYRAIYVADMAVVIGVFASLMPHAQPDVAGRYIQSARRFAQALERDGMVLPSGACGVGWLDTRVRAESTVVRTPYLVSTALAGIECHAWLFARTHEREYRRRALAALDYTLQAMQSDGSFAPVEIRGIREGPYVTAAYVEEGWMAADHDLDDADVLRRLKRALPKHVDWLLRTQREDGTWGSQGEDGEAARTPAILNFLLWYDQRCEEREDVRQAVRRASPLLLDPDRWLESGLLRKGKNEDVQRAITGRVLAALVGERPVY
jgi:hypothetical protein